MQTSQRGIDLIKRFESFSLKLYKDSAGYSTIGYGHKLKTGEQFTTVTIQEAERILRKDLDEAEGCLNKYLIEKGTQLTQYEFDALTSLVFNIGTGSFIRGNIPGLLRAGKPVDVGAKIPEYCKSGGVRMRGLYRRRLVESAYFLGGSNELVDYVYNAK
jgi:lysozyme